MPRFSQLVYNGLWFGDECQLLLSMLETAQKDLDGKVKIKLYKGSLIPVGRWSEKSLYDEDVASMEADEGRYNQDDATGFIRLNGLPLSTVSRMRKK
jgi:argininosuccinate synthase